MNLKLQALVLAAAMAMSVSGAANATLANGASGNSSVFLTVLDNTNNISALFDLGLNYNDFASQITPGINAAGTTYSWDLTSANYSAAWNTFLGTADLSTSKWAIYTGDNAGNGAGARGMVVTYSSGVNFSNSQLQTGQTSFDTYLNANANLGNHQSVENGASSATSTNAFAESASAYGTNGRVAGQGNLITWGNFDTSLKVVSLVRSNTSAGSNTTFTNYNNQYGDSLFSLTSAGGLTYAAAAATAPVPEPETYAMLLAGLGLMGAIARRRTAK